MAWITSLRGHQGCPEISIRNHVLNTMFCKYKDHIKPRSRYVSLWQHMRAERYKGSYCRTFGTECINIGGFALKQLDPSLVWFPALQTGWSRWEHGHHFQMNGFSLKVEQVPSLYPWVQSKGWGVQAMARPRSNYYQLLMFFLFNELSRTTMRPHCTHESHNQVESLTRDLKRPYEGSEARTWTTLSTFIGVCQQAGSYHNFYVWFVVPDVEILG